MDRSALRRLGAFTLAALFVALLGAGCSSERSTGPVVPNAQNDSSSLYNSPGAPSPAAVTLGLTRPLNALTETTAALIDGADGGVIASGRFTLVVPPGAFKGAKTISLVVPDKNLVQCQLLPEGTQFDVPVTLSMNLLLTDADVASATIYWYNPATAAWVDMGGTYDSATHSVRAQLQHFSEYAGGRAGW